RSRGTCTSLSFRAERRRRVVEEPAPPPLAVVARTVVESAMTASPFIRTAGTFIPGAKTLPREYYTSPDILARETEQLFRERWLWVARAERVAKPGDYFLYEEFGESVIVLRDRAGVLRAFYNVCRHRGTRMCEAKS